MNSLVWYAGIYAGSAALLKCAGFLVFLWLARTLSVDEYATFGLLYALQTGITTFATAGIVESLIGLLRRSDESSNARQVFAAANSVFAIISLPVSLLTLMLLSASLISRQQILPSTLGAFMVGLTTAYCLLQSQVVRLEEKHFASLAFSFLVPLVGLASGVASFVLSSKIAPFFFGTAVGSLGVLCLLRFLRVGSYGWSTRRDSILLLLKKLPPFFAIAFFGWLSGYGNNYLVELMFLPVEIAKFTFAVTLTAVLQVVATALNQVWSPRFYRIVHERPASEVEQKNRTFFTVQGVALGAVGGAVIAALPAFLAILGGNLHSYKSMSAELVLLFSGYVVLSPWWHCNNYYLAHGKGEELMRVVLVTSLIGVAAWIVFMWWLGPIGIYWGFLLQMVLRSMGIVTTAKRHWPIRVSWVGVFAGLALTMLGQSIAGSYQCSGEGADISCAAF